MASADKHFHIIDDVSMSIVIVEALTHTNAHSLTHLHTERVNEWEQQSEREIGKKLWKYSYKNGLRYYYYVSIWTERR